MHNFTASFAEIAVLGVGMTLLVAWITFVKTAEIKASLADLAQEDVPKIANSAEMEAARKGALDAVSVDEAAIDGV